jgi:transcriptional regulator with XRE-family HTH domain
MKGLKKKASPVHQDSKNLRKKVGSKLKHLRKELGYENGDDFAYDSGINRSQYGKYEAGSQDMRLSSLLRTINSLGLTIEEFFSSGFDSNR